MKCFNFNRIYIIQSINPTDPRQEALRGPGPELERVINEKLGKLKEADNSYNDVACELICVDGVDNWKKIWDHITEDCRNGIKPIIHFICHGNKDFMAITNEGKDYLLSWQVVYDTLEKANEACHNNLFVTMCICYGFWSLKKIFTDGNRVPFCGILACPDTVNVYDAKVRFSDFYLTLLTNKDVSDAINKVIEDINKVWKLIGERPNDLIIKFSDELFVKCFRNIYKSRRDDRELKKETVNALLNAGLPVIEPCIDEYVNAYHKNIPQIYKRMVNHKFMFDLYPEERSRFDIPDNLEDLDK